MPKRPIVQKYKIVSKKKKEDNDLYYVTSCGVVCGDDVEPINLDAANTRLALYKKRGYKELLIVVASDYKAPVALDNTLMENITFNSIYVPKKDDRYNIDYINMVRFSDSVIGTKLSIGSPINLNSSMFGEIGTIKNFMDFITNPKFPQSLLKKKKISSEVVANIPKCKSRILPNYWGIVTTILIERIRNDKVLVEELLLLPKTVKFTMFKLKSTEDVAGNKVSIVTPMTEYLRYCIIIQDIFNALKHNREALSKPNVIIEIIKKNTACKDKDLYTGLEIVCK